MTVRYHSDFALDHFADAASLRAKRGRPYQALYLLARLWLAANDPWAVNPIVNVAHSRLHVVTEDRRNLSRLVGLLVKAGAVVRLGHTKAGTKYKLIKPPVSELSRQAQAELLTMAASDYRRDPQDKKPPVAVQSEEGNLVVIPQAQLKQAKQDAKDQKTRVREHLKRIGKKRSDIAQMLEKLAKYAEGTLRYSGPGSDATAAACEWLAEHRVGWQAFRALLKDIYLDKSDDKPDRIEYVFETDKRDYLNRIVAQHKANKKPSSQAV